MRICTIIAKNYVPFARVLATSFKKHHPKGSCGVLVIDDVDGYLDPAEEPFELITPDVLEIDEFDRMTVDYDVVELSTAVKPWLLRHLLSESSEPITYLDPDIEIFGKLDKIDDLAREHGIVLIPHLTAPLPRDGKMPSDWDILRAGTYNLGFIALGQTPGVDQLLDWWSERMETDCIVDPEAGLFVDQRWIDLVPNLLPDVAVVRDPGFDVAYWNLPTRQLERNKKKKYMVNGQPLHFFHYSGFDPRRPHLLSKHQDRLDPATDPVLRELLQSYAKKVRAAGYDEARNWPYSYPDRLSDGTRLTRLLRRLLGEAREVGVPRSSPFTDAGTREFIDWLNTPAAEPAGEAGVTRYLAALHETRSDLSRAFPDLDGAGATELVGWAQIQGRDAGDVPDALTPLPERLSDGTVLTGFLRELCKEALCAGAVTSPLHHTDGLQQLLAWLNEPTGPGADRGVTRYLGALHGSRSDLLQRFPDLHADAYRFISWAQTTGLAEGRVPRSLLPVPSSLPDGTEVDWWTVDLCRLAIAEGAVTESLWSDAGMAQALAWLAAPAPDAPKGPVTRCLFELWRLRPDLQRAYPDPLGISAEALLGWAKRSGRREHQLLARTMEYEAGADAVMADRSSEERADLLSHDSIDDERHNRLRPRAPFGVNVTGYFNAELGVGEAARRAITGLDAAGVPLVTFTQHAPISRADHHFATAGCAQAPFPVNLICVNADTVPTFANEVGEDFFAGRHSIGMWFWEVTSFPDAWHNSFRYLDEIWVATEHIAEGLRPVSTIPVSKITLPIALPRGTAPARSALGLPDGFIFLFTFDYLSVFRRKNPLAVIEAFNEAFAGHRGPSLVMKCINAEERPEEHQELLEAAGEHPDVHVVDRYLSPLEKNALLASCDCYVSLHRAEGFGFGPAEAMYLGKPVIATGYSGNLDYMTEANSYLVDYKLVPIGPEAPPYPEDGEWAEPDVEHAAALMREVYDRPDLSSRRGQRGAEDIRRTHSPAAAGAEMRNRIEQAVDALKPSRRHAATAPDGWAATVAEARLAGDLDVAIDFISRRLQDLERETVASLQELEETAILADASVRAALRAEGERLDDAFAHATAVHEAATAPARLLQNFDALPSMQEARFVERDDPIVGRVYGYDNGRPPAGDEGAYVALEEVFRAPQEVTSERQRIYLNLIGERDPVLDAGCGRGEFLDLLTRRGLQATGVDVDPAMVRRAAEKGHRVIHADVNEYLSELDDESLGTVFSAQLVEHLDPEELVRFIHLARRKLRDGGLLIAETINPHAARALKTFWIDITRKRPLFPEAMLELCRASGFGAAWCFHPNGTGRLMRDRREEVEYAIVATVESTEPAATEAAASPARSTGERQKATRSTRGRQKAAKGGRPRSSRRSSASSRPSRRSR